VARHANLRYATGGNEAAVFFSKCVVDAVNTTRFARYARGFLAGTRSVSDIYTDLCEGIEAWAAELEAGGCWHQWDQDAYCKRKRFAKSRCERLRDADDIECWVVAFLNATRVRCATKS
jgi:hypothetical protein